VLFRSEILERAKIEDRILLTRDKKLAERAGEHGLYVSARDLDEQLRQVTGAYGLIFEEDRSRCTACNGELTFITKDEALKGVPEGALRSNEQFFKCGSCGKYYWKGSHWRNIRRMMAILTESDHESSR
jgi:uncharacterized protein